MSETNYIVIRVVGNWSRRQQVKDDVVRAVSNRVGVKVLDNGCRGIMACVGDSTDKLYLIKSRGDYGKYFEGCIERRLTGEICEYLRENGLIRVEEEEEGAITRFKAKVLMIDDMTEEEAKKVLAKARNRRVDNAT